MPSTWVVVCKDRRSASRSGWMRGWCRPSPAPQGLLGMASTRSSRRTGPTRISPTPPSAAMKASWTSRARWAASGLAAADSSGGLRLPIRWYFAATPSRCPSSTGPLPGAIFGCVPCGRAFRSMVPGPFAGTPTRDPSMDTATNGWPPHGSRWGRPRP